MKNNQGFSLIAGLLIILIMAVVAFAGYYVWNENKKPQNVTVKNTIVTTPQTVKEVTDEEINYTISSVDKRIKIPKLQEWELKPGYPHELYDSLASKDYKGSNEHITNIDEGSIIGIYFPGPDKVIYSNADEHLKQLEGTHHEYCNGYKIKEIATYKVVAYACAHIDSSENYDVKFSKDGVDTYVTVSYTVDNSKKDIYKTEENYKQFESFLAEFVKINK